MTDDDRVASNLELNRLLLWMVLIALGVLAFSAYAWVALPDDIRIPVHWGIDGEPDRYGGKVEGLFLLPAVIVLIAGVFRLLPIIEPRRINLLRSFTAYRFTALAIAAFLALLHALHLARLLGLIDSTVTYWLGFLLSGLFMTLGNYLGKVRSNFMFGIRTPWTLSSELTWNKTHRLAGKLFFASGLLGIVATAGVPAHGLKIALGLIIAASLFSVIYSWFVWRDAPDRKSM